MTPSSWGRAQYSDIHYCPFRSVTYHTTEAETIPYNWIASLDSENPGLDYRAKSKPNSCWSCKKKLKDRTPICKMERKLKNFIRMKMNEWVGKLTTVSSKICRVPSLRYLHNLTKHGSRTSSFKKISANLHYKRLMKLSLKEHLWSLSREMPN